MKRKKTMKYREEFSFLKGTWTQLKKLNHTVNQLIENLNNDKLYAINYTNLKTRFIEEIEKYKHAPELIDINEFSMNYSFGYHYCNNIDDMRSKEAMFIEVKRYINNLETKS